MTGRGWEHDDKGTARHPCTHAYEQLLVRWFVAAVTAREEGHDAPSTRPPLLRALARRVERVLTAMSPPQRRQGDGGGGPGRGPQGRHQTGDGEMTARSPCVYAPAAYMKHPLQVARGFLLLLFLIRVMQMRC